MKRAAFAAVLFASVSLAHADKRTSLDHYNKGKQAYAAATFETAIAEFELAYTNFPAPEYLHDIAQAYRRLDRPCDALAYFERYLAAKPDAKNRVEVEAHIASLRDTCAPAIPPSAPAAPAPATPAPRAAVAAKTPVVATSSVAVRVDRPVRSPYSLAAAAGLLILDAGPVVMPPLAQLEVGVRRRLGGAYDLHVGAGIALARLPYDDMRSGTVWLTSPQLTVDAARMLRPRISLVGGLAAGVVVVSGLDTGNPFVEDNMAAGTVVTARVRAEIGVAWRASDTLAVRVMPLGYQWSPARGGLASDIRALHGLAMSAGLTVEW